MNRWASLAIIMALSGGAMGAPDLISAVTGTDPQSMTRALQSLQKLQTAKSGGASEAEVLKQLKGLQGGGVESLPLDKLAALQDFAGLGEGVEGKALLGSKLLEAYKKQTPIHSQLRSQVLRDCEKARQLYRRFRPKVILAIGLLSLTTIVVLFLGVVPLVRGLARFYLTVLFALSRIWIILLSMATLAYFAASGHNPWPVLPRELFCAPVSSMLLCALFIRKLDPNFPVWNDLLKGLAAPIAACVAIAGVSRYGVQGLLQKAKGLAGKAA